MNDFLAPNIWPEETWREPSRALAAASAEQRRRVATRAAEIAIAHHALEFPEALAALRAGRFGDCELRAAVWVRVDAYDESYFDAEDAGDDATARREFAHARAASALYFALSANPDEAAANALYEARHSLDDAGQVALVAMIEDELPR
jgi:hypothetical protein